MTGFHIQLKAGEQKVLQKRTELLGKNQEQDQHSDQKSLDCLLFTSGGIHYAIEKDFVQELHRHVNPLSLPCTPEFVKGIVNIRGSILSVNDLGLFLGNPPLKHSEDLPMFKIQDSQLSLGILADSIDDIVSISMQSIFPFEQPDHPRLKHFLFGVTQQMIYVLDTAAILSDPDLIVKT